MEAQEDGVAAARDSETADGRGHAEDDAIREQLQRYKEEKEAWIEERARLREEIEDLQVRCQTLARAAGAPPARSDAEVQTEASDLPGGEGGDGNMAEAGAGGRLPPVVEQMLRSPKDETIQLKCIEALFAEQTQVDASSPSASAPALRGSLEAAVAIFNNHPGNRALCLKASQFLSVLLAEPNAEEHLPLAVLFQAAQDVVVVGGQILADVAAGIAVEVGGSPSPSKLLTWFLSLLALLLPCLGTRLRDRTQGEAFVQDLLCKLVSPLLASTELPQEALIVKCVQLLPLLPVEPWIQKACLESQTVHGLALVYHRLLAGASGSAAVRGDAAEAPLLKGVRTAVGCVFSQNLELCVRAVEDTFVSDAFVCVEVLEELRGAEKKQRGTFVALDSDWGLTPKALGLWAFHQRRALEDPEPMKCASREVLQKVADLLCSVLMKLPPKRLLQRMQEFQDAEVLQRIALATIHSSAQLRLQVAVNYLENDVVGVVIACMQTLLHSFEEAAHMADVEAAFRLLQDEKLPAEGWPYVLYCLDICIHVLSHWSATKATIGKKADVLDARAAPLLLAQGGLVDVLAEIVDPVAAGVETTAKPPPAVLHKATETLQALFEQNGHICLFCMQHYTEVRQMIALGCDSLAMDPLAEFPDMQEQAVEQLAASFEKFAVQDERLGRKILKAIAVLFESSYRLVVWFLRKHPLNTLGELSSLDVHTEAVRAVARAPYWSSEDAPLLPEFVALIAQLLMGSVEGLGPDDVATSRPGRRVLDLQEAEEVVSACISSVLHLLLIDPSPPTVLECLAKSLAQFGQASDPSAISPPEADDTAGGSSEQSVGAVMRVMQVFPSSDRVQMNCQHLLTSLLGE